PQMQVFGNDYPTRDGSCIRDFVHVSDIADAHTLALEYLLSGKSNKRCEVFNLGTGNGDKVLEAIKAFDKISRIKLNDTIAPRRPGDVVAIYANNDHARKTLGWNPRYDLEAMMATAWKWEQKLNVDERLFQKNSAGLN